MPSDEISLTVEETNALRAKLGLKPLRIGPSESASGSAPASSLSVEQQDTRAVENLRQRREQQSKVARDDAARERLFKAKQRIERDRILQGPSLGDKDQAEGGDEGESTLAWIKRTRKAPKIIQPQDEPAKPAKSYTEENLQGLKVAHELDNIHAGTDIVMTLQDADVLDETDDHLINADLVAQEKRERDAQQKSKNRTLNGYDQGTGSLLSKYDEEIEGQRKSSGFVISRTPRSDTDKLVQAQRKQDDRRGVRTTIYDDDDDENDFMNTTDDNDMVSSKRKLQSFEMPERPIKLKKRGKKKPEAAALAHRRMKALDEEKPVSKATSAPLRFDDESRSSDVTITRTKTAEEIAKEVRSRTSQESLENDDRTAGLVLDNVTSFAAGLQHKARVAQQAQPVSTDLEDPMSIDESVRQPQISTSEVTSTIVQTPSVVNASASSTGLEDEKTLDRGLGVAMSLLKQKGALEDVQEAESAEDRREREAWLAKDRKARLDLELERSKIKEMFKSDPKVKSMTNRQREEWLQRETRRIDQLEAKAAQERFRDYKPKVDLTYVDEFGRKLDTKQAWKHMSQQFHGKFSGAAKTAKKLERIDKERERERQHIFK
ncbi:hypothetical protein PYCC9005_003338 [Savitreella phatthalungensis]